MHGTFQQLRQACESGQIFQEYLGLPWKAGDYHRTDFFLNRRVRKLARVSMPTAYSQRALHLKGVRNSAAVYLPAETSRTQSLVFAPSAIDDLSQTPIAFAAVQDGWVRYVGDVNNELGSQTAILAMCGLLPSAPNEAGAKEPNQPSSVPAPSTPFTLHTTSCCAKCQTDGSQLVNGLKACAKCHPTRYCSRECQKADWKEHKKTCSAQKSSNTGQLQPTTASAPSPAGDSEHSLATE